MLDTTSAFRHKKYYTNRYARILLKAYEEVLGRERLNSVLRLAGMTRYIDQYPPDNNEYQVSVADFKAINQAIEASYGAKGGRGLALRAGRAAFSELVDDVGRLIGANQARFKFLPMHSKIKIGLPNTAHVLIGQRIHGVTLEERENGYSMAMPCCPDEPQLGQPDRLLCYLTVGLLEEEIKWLTSGQEWRVMETCCAANGHDRCEFLCQKTNS